MSPIFLIAQDPAETITMDGPVAQPRFQKSVAIFFLQISHRLGAVALFATIGTWGMMFAIRDFHVPLAIACGCADGGLCSAMIARGLSRKNRPVHREAGGAAVFNLVIFVLSLYLMIFARLDVIRSAASEFFTPTPPTAAAR